MKLQTYSTKSFLKGKFGFPFLNTWRTKSRLGNVPGERSLQEFLLFAEMTYSFPGPHLLFKGNKEEYVAISIEDLLKLCHFLQVKHLKKVYIEQTEDKLEILFQFCRKNFVDWEVRPWKILKR